MREDLTVFWKNNARAYELFADLLARTERSAYDDDFLMQLAAYREESPDSGHADIFAAQYLLHHGDAEGAVCCGERAYQIRPINYVTWQVLSSAYAACGRYTDALVMQGYPVNFFKVPISLNIPSHVLTEETLNRLSIATGIGNYAPFTVSRMRYDTAHGLTACSGIFFDEFLPVSPQITPAYYVGAYTEQEIRGNKFWLGHGMRNVPGIIEKVAGDFTFDIMRGQRSFGTAHVDVAADDEIVLPIIGTQQEQILQVRTDSVDDTTWISPGSPNFFRLNRSTDFSSEQDFIVGTPIHLKHDPKRRRLVLNLLVDALSWSVLRHDFAQRMPHAHQFFQRGVIFDQHFSALEYTYPSLPTIETGMYAHHSQIFNEWSAIELRADYITLSERMRTCGYATTSLMSAGDGIYNGTTRGYDRLIVTPYHVHAYEGAERLIRCLGGLHDADHFIFLHMMDVHPWAPSLFQAPTTVQTSLPLATRLSGAEEKVPSPYLKPTRLNQEIFWQGIAALDRGLGTIFSYLEENYAPDEYLVTLYSDHGVPIFSSQHHIVDTQMTGAVWMMRGGGVSEGVIAHELTSAVDLYPTLGHLLGFPVGGNVDGVLPKVFGGPGREIAYSNSLFPGKPYHLAARSKTHTLCLETAEPSDLNGTVDLSTAEVHIYPRAHENEEAYKTDSEELRAFFYPRVRAFLKGIDSNGEQFPHPPFGSDE